MKFIQKIDIYKIFSVIIIIGTVFLGYITYANLGKGFIFNDEAYYLSYFKNKGEYLSFDRTNYFRIFKFLYTPDIHRFRINTTTTLILSNFILYFCVFKYFKINKYIFVFSLIGIFVAFHTWSITNLSLQQYIGNTILVNIGLSLILISFILKKQFIILFAGFILSFILFDGNSHVVVLIPISLFLWLADKEKRITNCLYYLAGFSIGIIIYFTTMDTTENFLDQFKFLKEYLTFHRKQHSKRFMVLWFVYLFLNAILPVAIAYFFLKKAKFSLKSVSILEKIVAVTGILTVITYFFFLEYGYIMQILFTHLLVLRFWLLKDEPIANKYLITLLLVIPYGLTFGSQTWFNLRLHVYIVYYFLLTLICFIKLYRNISWIAGYSIVLIFLIVTFPARLTEKGWKDFVFTEQNEKVKVNGYDLYLDKGRKKDLDDLRPYLENQPNVIYSSNHLMGYLYMLDATPPIYYYFTLKDYIDYIIKKVGKTPDDYIYIESNDYPFSPKEIIPLKFVNHPEKYKVVKTGRFTLYLPAQFQKK